MSWATWEASSLDALPPEDRGIDVTSANVNDSRGGVGLAGADGDDDGPPATGPRPWRVVANAMARAATTSTAAMAMPIQRSGPERPACSAGNGQAGFAAGSPGSSVPSGVPSRGGAGRTAGEPSRRPSRFATMLEGLDRPSSGHAHGRAE